MLTTLIMLSALYAPPQATSYLDQMVDLRRQNAILQARVSELEACIRIYDSITVSPNDPMFQAQWDKAWEKEVDAEMLRDYKNGTKHPPFGAFGGCQVPHDVNDEAPIYSDPPTR